MQQYLLYNGVGSSKRVNFMCFRICVLLRASWWLFVTLSCVMKQRLYCILECVFRRAVWRNWLPLFPQHNHTSIYSLSKTEKFLHVTWSLSLPLIPWVGKLKSEMNNTTMFVWLDVWQKLYIKGPRNWISNTSAHKENMATSLSLCSMSFCLLVKWLVLLLSRKTYSAHIFTSYCMLPSFCKWMDVCELLRNGYYVSI